MSHSACLTLGPVSRLATSLLALAIALALVAGWTYVSTPGPTRLDVILSRGAWTSEEVTSKYIAAMLRGDAGTVAWLMPTNRVQPRAIELRIARYRDLATETLTVEHLQHTEAAYLRGARISWRGAVIDEIAIQSSGGRWYLVHFP